MLDRDLKCLLLSLLVIVNVRLQLIVPLFEILDLLLQLRNLFVSTILPTSQPAVRQGQVEYVLETTNADQASLLDSLLLLLFVVIDSACGRWLVTHSLRFCLFKDVILVDLNEGIFLSEAVQRTSLRI